MADKHRAITTQGIPTCLCDGGGSRHQIYCGSHCECCEEHPATLVDGGGGGGTRRWRERERRYRNLSGGISDKDKSTIKQAGMGAGLFTMLIVIGGLIFLMSKIGQK